MPRCASAAPWAALFIQYRFGLGFGDTITFSLWMGVLAMQGWAEYSRHRAGEQRYRPEHRALAARVRRAQWAMGWVALGAWIVGAYSITEFSPTSWLGWAGGALAWLSSAGAVVVASLIPKRMGLLDHDTYALTYGAEPPQALPEGTAPATPMPAQKKEVVMWVEAPR